jgi:hypothetical protein
MKAASSQRLSTPAQRFVDRYGITPRSFVSGCLVPSLLAVQTVTFLYRGVPVETREVPAWKARLSALRTILAMATADEIDGKRIRVPVGALGLEQLTTIADGFLEEDWHRITPEDIAVCLTHFFDAENSVLLFYHGKLVDTRETEDHSTQIEAALLALRLWKAYPNDSDNFTFATSRDIALLISEARRRRRVIEIVRRTQIVQMR